MALKTLPFDAADAIDTPEAQAELLAEALASGDAKVVTAALGMIARAKGMSEAQLMELVAVVGMASETNRLATGLVIPVDEAFRDPPPKAADNHDRRPA